MQTEHASYVKDGNIITALGSSRQAVMAFLESEIPGIRQAKGLFREVFKKGSYRLKITLV